MRLCEERDFLTEAVNSSSSAYEVVVTKVVY